MHFFHKEKERELQIPREYIEAQHSYALAIKLLEVTWDVKLPRKCNLVFSTHPENMEPFTAASRKT